MSNQETIKKIIEIVEPFLNEDIAIDPDTAIFENGLIDSLNVLQIIARIESEFGVKISPLDVTFDDFQTCATIFDRIISRKG